MSEYYTWKNFENLYLEDSFVEDIDEIDGGFIFFMEFVLTEKHELYSTPKDSEQYCYKKGKIIFSGVNDVIWIRKNEKKFVDGSLEEDMGNIDILRKINNKYEIKGDWGDLLLIAASVDVMYL